MKFLVLLLLVISASGSKNNQRDNPFIKEIEEAQPRDNPGGSLAQLFNPYQPEDDEDEHPVILIILARKNNTSLNNPLELEQQPRVHPDGRTKLFVDNTSQEDLSVESLQVNTGAPGMDVDGALTDIWGEKISQWSRTSYSPGDFY